MDSLKYFHSSHESYPEKSKIKDGYQSETTIEPKVSSHILKNQSDNFQINKEVEKSLRKEMFSNDETFKIIRAILLALLILTVCYLGRMQYTILENGHILPGFVSSKKTIMFSLGYSISNSIMSAIAVGMLIYSIMLKRPQFSLPLISLFLRELVCDSCFAIITIWYLFKYLQLQTALLYAAELLSLILVEIWTWLSVLWLYEHRTSKLC